jgi:uncharacterized protein
MRDDDLPAPLAAKLDRLRGTLAAMDGALVALSGGVDSSFLLRVARDALGPRLAALTTVSPTNPEEDTATAIALARELGVPHLVIESNELDIPGYAANPINRCYLCKDSLYERCAVEARRLGLAAVADGVNTDDLRDYRPGLRAAEIHGVRHPLVDAGISKRELRLLSRALGLPTWDKPASPCLSSRFPYGTAITRERLAMVARAEGALRALGFRELRVRFHGELARIEVGAAELPRLLAPEVRRAAAGAVRAAGFHHVTVDLDGFRSGGLNAAAGLAPDSPRRA